MNRDSLTAFARAVVAILAGALVVAPLAIWGGWPGVGLIAAAVIAATVWWRRPPVWGRPW